MFGDAGELVYQGSTADDGKVIYLHLSGNLGGIPDNDVVLQHTVVSHVRIGHDEAIVAYDRLAFGGCSAVDGDALAQGGVVSDLCGGDFTFELQILWDSGYDSTGEYLAVLADTGTVQNDRMGE